MAHVALIPHMSKVPGGVMKVLVFWSRFLLLCKDQKPVKLHYKDIYDQRQINKHLFINNITVLSNYNIEKPKHQICRCLCRAAQRGALLNSYLTSQESGVYKAPPIKLFASVFYSTALSIIWPMKLDRQQKAEFVFLPCSTEMHTLNCKNDTWNSSTAPFKTLQNDWILKPNGNCVRCEKKKSIIHRL